MARRRDKLWHDRHGMCHYCKIKTVLPKVLAESLGLKVEDMFRKLKKEQYYHMATIDHLVPRYDIRRLQKTTKERTVLCCWKCNQARNRTEYEALPPEILKRFTKAGKPAMHTLRDIAREKEKATVLTKPTWLGRMISKLKEIYEYVQGRGRQSENRASSQCGKA